MAQPEPEARSPKKLFRAPSAPRILNKGHQEWTAWAPWPLRSQAEVYTRVSERGVCLVKLTGWFMKS